MNVLVTDVDEKRRHEMMVRHHLAIQSVGLIRTALNVQRPALEALLAAEHVAPPEVTTSPAFALQVRMVRSCLGFLEDLDALADEAISLAAKAKAS